MEDVYLQLLTFGYTNLSNLNVENLSDEDNITGVEESLFENPVYYRQILDLSRYVYTTASTNDPNNPYFQPMFVTGYMLKSQAKKLKPILEKQKIAFRFMELIPTGIKQKLFIPNNAYEISVIYNCLITFPDILEQILGRNPKLYTSKQIYKSLHPEDFDFIVQSLNYQSRNNPDPRLASIAADIIKGDYLLFESPPTNIFVELPDFAIPIRDQLVEFDIEDMINPDSRGLYYNLINVFQNHLG